MTELNKLIRTILLVSILSSGARSFTHPSLIKCPTLTTKNTEKRICNQYFSSSRYLTVLSATLAPETANKSGITSSLISNAAIVALKLRLARHSGVACEVNASSSNIIFNRTIGPVSVKGRGWESPLGLSCRAIEANVDRCSLDMNRVIRDKKLSLIEPAMGKAMIALDATDFGNFITHPLLKAQTPCISGKQEHGFFEFLKEDVDIIANPNNKEDEGLVIFYGNCLGERWRCELRRGAVNAASSNQAIIKVMPASSNSASSHSLQEESRELSTLITLFFNSLVFELGGTYLSFKDLFITSSSKSKSNDRSREASNTQVLISLAIKVKKFPSPGTPF